MHRDITDLFLQSLKPPVTGRLEIHDARVNGLMLRVTPAGMATWSVRQRLADGKRVRPSIGHWPEVSIREARRAARIMLGDIAGGKDPVAEKRQARAERVALAARPTVETRLTEWRTAKAAKWSPRYAREVERLCSKIIVPRLGNRRLEETSRADWIGMIAAEREQRPATATWLYQIASAFSNYAEICGWLPVPLLPRRAIAIVAPKGEPRQRVLSDAELAAVWGAAAGRSPRVRCFVRLLILTGCRVSEAAGIAAGELDLVHNRWTIPALRAKNKRAITLPLPASLAADLAALVPANARPGFCPLGAIPGSPLQSISRVKASLDAASGVEDWVLHDLRRTARTGMARLGVATEHAEAALNHISGRSQLVRTYDTHDYGLEILAAVRRWQDHVAELTRPRLVAA
jgi:integrase